MYRIAGTIPRTDQLRVYQKNLRKIGFTLPFGFSQSSQKTLDDALLFLSGKKTDGIFISLFYLKY